MSEARAAILDRIHRANGGASDEPAATAGWAAIARTYRQGSEASRQAVLELFAERLRDYDAEVVRCPAPDSAHDIASAIAARLGLRGKRRVLVPHGFPEELLPQGFEFVRDEGFPPLQLDAFDSVLTTATLGIAETGTFVLQNTPGQGRRAITLIPDYHLCLVRAEDVVATVPEALQRLQPTAALATTFVSGPSATADIEMTRIKGVHGPRLLDIVLVG